MQAWKLILDKLLTESCLVFGQYSKFTSKNVARYLLGTREMTEIFKLYELRYLLLKIYPLIHNLFHNPRVNPKLESRDVYLASNKRTVEPLSLPKPQIAAKPSTWPFRQSSSFVLKQKNLPPQILFASVSPSFSQILHDAAQICNMPWHQNRWLSGAMTAALSYPSDKLLWQFLQDSTQKEVFKKAFIKWGGNKQNKEKIKEKFKHYSRSRWPSLIIIPDISNNIMILKEAQKIGLPVMGLINSNCSIEIDYPIFAQNQTLQSIHFFCHFLAVLIAKETVYFQHKCYTLQKASYKTKNLTNRKVNLFSTEEENKLSIKKRKIFTLEQAQKFQKITEFWHKKPFFFNVVKPQQDNSLQRDVFVQKFNVFRDQIFFLLKINSRKFVHAIPSIKRFKKIKTFKKKVYIKKQKIKNKARGSFKNIPHRFRYSAEDWKRPRIRSLTMTKFFNYYKLNKIVIKPETSLFRQENKLFETEYQKKYLKRKIYTYEESKHVKNKLQNFLWIEKIRHLWRLDHRLFQKPPGFISAPHYFRRSLQQLSQNTILRNMLFLFAFQLQVKKLEKRHNSKWIQRWVQKNKHRVSKTHPYIKQHEAHIMAARKRRQGIRKPTNNLNTWTKKNNTTRISKQKKSLKL